MRIETEKRTGRRAVLLCLSLLALLSLPLPGSAVPVQQPYADFPKAIVFTGANRPDSTVPIIVADGNGGSTDTRSGFILTPLGDGSWAVMATVYPGSSYQYYFEYRIPEFEADSSAAFRTTEPNGTRNQDSNRGRTVTIPATAGNGYVIYNAYGDRSVWGAQGADTTFSTGNPFLASWRPTTLISSGTDHETSGSLEGTNSYNVSAIQLGTSKAQLAWDYSIGGDGFVPHVEGASRFRSGAPLYGWEVLRAESNPATPLAQLNFQNITASVTGSAVYSDNDNNPWTAPTYFWDTAIVARPDSVFVYTVRVKNAYGMNGRETMQFTWTGGYSTIRWNRPAAEVDGTVDSGYGVPIATDPRGDQGTDFKNLDLTRMWVTRDLQNLYFALEIAADIFATNWGCYIVLIDVTGDSNGAPDFKHSSLGSYAKNVAFPARRPEYALVIKTSNQSTGPPADVAELMYWNGSSWSSQGNAVVSRSSNGETSWIEASVAYTWPSGFVPRIWTEAFSTGNDQNNPARDVINKLAGDSQNNEWNMTSWSGGTTGRLSVATPYPPALLPPAGLTLVSWDTRVIASFVAPAQNINLIDHFELFLDSDYARVRSGAPSVRIRSVANNVLVVESTALQAHTRYYGRVFSVAVDGESIGSNIATCVSRGVSDSITVTYTDSLGVTELEVTKGNLRYADTFFYVEILDYNEIYALAQYTDTERASYLALIDAANRHAFFDPTLQLISSGIYPDTYSPVRQITIRRSDGSRAPADYFVEVSLRIPYLTTDSTTVYSPNFVNERRLVIRKLNPATGRWEVPNSERTQWVQTDSDRVVVLTSEFSIWNVLAGAGDITNFDRLVVYPNPFNAKEYIDAGHPLPARITFAFMPPSTDRVELYNISGERVRILNREDGNEFEVQGASVIAKWDGKNENGRDVASGIYVYWIRANGQTKVGKVAVVR